MHVSGFQRYMDDLARQGIDPTLTRLSQLNPSLLQDLMRFEQDGRQTELLEVVAACMRHARPLVIYLQYNDHVIPLTLFPLERLAHCPLPIRDFLAVNLAQVVVMRVEPAVVRAPGDPEYDGGRLIGNRHLYHPLGAVMWQLAIKGSREMLLPEIGGVAAYRIAAGSHLRDVPDERARAQRRATPATPQRQPARYRALGWLQPWQRHAPAQRTVPARIAHRQPHGTQRVQRQLVWGDHAVLARVLLTRF